MGQALCVECYDYTGAVLWNAAVGEVWRRTVIAAYRELAHLVSGRLGVRVGVRRVRELLRISYTKVAEFQKRGLVHVHAVFRLDGADPDDRDRVVAVPSWADRELLADAVEAAASHASVRLPGGHGVAHWGEQREVREIAGDADRAEGRATAAYLAKYATKTAGAAALAYRLKRFHWPSLVDQVGPHLARMVATCWHVGARREYAGLRRWAHTLGFSGHFATKSRRYSLTLGALRRARRRWRQNQRAGNRAPDVWGVVQDEKRFVLDSDFRYAGRGYVSNEQLDVADMLARLRGPSSGGIPKTSTM